MITFTPPRLIHIIDMTSNNELKAPCEANVVRDLLCLYTFPILPILYDKLCYGFNRL